MSWMPKLKANSQKRVGPVSFIGVMLVASFVGLGAVPHYMPDVIGLGADAAIVEAERYSDFTTLASRDGAPVEPELLSDWVVYQQDPLDGEVVRRDTPVLLSVRLTDQAVTRRVQEERLAAEQAERERLEAAQAEQARLAAAEEARQQREAAAVQAAAERAERERLAAEQAEQDRLAAEQAERDRQAAAARPTQAPSAPEDAVPIVHPGSFCSTEGARGRTSAGTAMRCTTTATDSRLRWRRA